ncbi:cell division protein FtsQ/DivIB [Fervidibacillus halotolerans]|uniref:Cell division protein DivIB n=1 Tax=Fervidibacillus halotolerans TaxID=2980027 RepID=A0A9E8RYC8_9BACI|nr:FtsQ-type POTRA domain-containing protein [Fervidibacillus halotolerans]WAA13680.1 FtsQ-type POTRA domain-containing protein [Fervidibacillus halotolerans]
MTRKVVSIEDRIPKLKERRKRKENRRLILILLLFFFIIIIIAYFQSPLSKVGSITVKGNTSVTNEVIIEKSGITEKTIVLNIDKGEAQASLTELPEIKSTHIHVQFPNKVLISVEEFERIGLIEENGDIYPLLESGERASNKLSVGKGGGPLLREFSGHELIQMATDQLVQIPFEIRNAISEIVYSPSKTDQYRVVLYMNDGFEVHATLRTLADKIKYYPSVIKQLDPKQKGIIDLEVGMFFKSYQSILQDEINQSGDGNEE